ncbi:hypothetical protein [Gluconobacter cerinus]|uniref:hypothetical protein n=1 Tax=Gluconobacter cerinus TaxID=38307 RepID=UPI001C05BC6D|nr:hypothetical protein [Gluconobacter cerinus]
MGDVSLQTAADPRFDDHERRITALEVGMTAIQVKLSEVQTEGRMRGERQDTDLRDLKSMISTLLGGMSFFKWAGAMAVTILAFLAIYGERLLHFWQALHT